MIEPPPARFIEGATDLMPIMVPTRLMSITCRKRSTSCLLDRREVEDAGVVDEDRHRTEPLLGVGHRRDPVVLGGDVEVPVGRGRAELGGHDLAPRRRARP